MVRLYVIGSSPPPPLCSLQHANAVPLHPPTGSVPTPHLPGVHAPLTSTTRQERVEMMREKREQQRRKREQQKRKREVAQAKLGRQGGIHCCRHATIGSSYCFMSS